MSTFDPEKTTKHWDILFALKEHKTISYKQAEAQLKDLGMEEWELRLYLDDDQEAVDD